ncbi:MAG TPA: sigma-70 family RNA polymerase sigma factor [Candidatus Sulfotelmatobacter sp.]|nr:sigma-70 family RNA polymerase sigma factor [Candidatus Sulfotelmatobacter sp.]
MVSSSQTASPQRRLFVTTQWSIVLKAGHGDTTHASEALERLCRTYWYPIYACVRRRGHSPEDAQDLAQSFFLRLLEQQSLANANPELGRFRSFLLGALNHFLIDEWKKARTQRRGGGRPLLSLDWAAAERRFDLEPVDHTTPGKAFDKNWATALLEEVLKQLEAEYQREEKLEMFRVLKQTLTGARESQPYASLAKRLSMTEGAVRVAVHRLRKRYRALLEAEIANTVSSQDEVKEEIAYLLRTMRGE